MYWMIVGAILLLFTPSESFACDCRNLSLEDQFALADAVFVGRVTSIYAPLNASSHNDRQYDDPALNEKLPVEEAGPYNPVRMRFQVQETLKGTPSRLTNLQTGYGDGDCGMEVEVDNSYVFFASRKGYVGICTGGQYYHPRNKDAVQYLDKLRSLSKSKTR